MALSRTTPSISCASSSTECAVWRNLATKLRTRELLKRLGRGGRCFETLPKISARHAQMASATELILAVSGFFAAQLT